MAGKPLYDFLGEKIRRAGAMVNIVLPAANPEWPESMELPAFTGKRLRQSVHGGDET
jgi:hypothetical protein